MKHSGRHIMVGHWKMRTTQKLTKFIEFAISLAGLSQCSRKQVGCIIFPEDFSAVEAIGYNGPPTGGGHECTGKSGSCGCVHAEANAISKLNTAERNLILFCTWSPCIRCAGLIANTKRISRVLYYHPWRDLPAKPILNAAGVSFEQVYCCNAMALDGDGSCDNCKGF